MCGELGAAAAHDVERFCPCAGNLGQLMLMMLANDAGFGPMGQAEAADAHDVVRVWPYGKSRGS